MKLVLATKNGSKIKEIRDKFSSLGGLELLSLNDFPGAPSVMEDGTTFRDNALKKARETASFTGMPALADDSGLVVDALNGEPGVYSARYAGEGASDADLCALVLKKMVDVAPEDRTARFVCVIAIVFPGGSEYVAEGSCEGIIIGAMRGDNGFGYDPIFCLPDFRRTMAELSLAEKNRISHRARALEKAQAILSRLS